MLPWDECKLKSVIAKQPFLASIQICKKAGIEGSKKDKRCKFRSVKKSPKQLPLTKTNILKH